MHLKTLHAVDFKRFTDLRVEGLSSTARLIVLDGPNGTGKSSFFDALKIWHWYNGAPGGGYDKTYHDKNGQSETSSWTELVKVELHDDLPTTPAERKKLVYVRSAHRNEADFSLNGLSQLGSPLDSVRVQRTIDNDMSVAQNYQRLVLETMSAVYDDTNPDDMSRIEIRDKFIGVVRDSLKAVFPELILTGVSPDPINGGTFLFIKGSTTAFPYKNLSAGEKAAFDLILDMAMSGRFYDQTIWCIDEPETHLNVRIQSTLLTQLLKLLPAGCQLILASHSIGFMRRAWELSQANPNDVQFLDFNRRDFDQPVLMTPSVANRDFWNDTLDVALGDLATLVAPEQVVLCEGRPVSAKGKASRSEFDARCYRKIFAGELPNTDFISIGNSDQVKEDKIELGRSIQAIAAGAKLVRVTDGDWLTEQEIADLRTSGVQVLGRRNLEAYLLDDEVIDSFCAAQSHGELAEDLKTKRDSLMAASVAAGKDADDFKQITGKWYVYARNALGLTKSGSAWEAFAVEHLASAFSPAMTVYKELKASIFDAAA